VGYLGYTPSEMSPFFEGSARDQNHRSKLFFLAPDNQKEIEFFSNGFEI
jgi:hypothetical protein